jgi:hypothetical protein
LGKKQYKLFALGHTNDDSCIYRFVDEDTFVDEEDATVQVEAPIDGFVYLYSRSSE